MLPNWCLLGFSPLSARALRTLELHALNPADASWAAFNCHLLTDSLIDSFCGEMNFSFLPIHVVKEEQKTSLLVRLEESIPPEVMGFGMGEFDVSLQVSSLYIIAFMVVLHGDM